jgi:hypothetical protein
VDPHKIQELVTDFENKKAPVSLVVKCKQKNKSTNSSSKKKIESREN